MSLYEGAVKKPIMTSLCFLAVAIFGLFSLSKLPVDLYPDIETNTIMVMTTYQGASASDIENNVTRPLENVLNSVSNLKHITSRSSENISVITLEFESFYLVTVYTPNSKDGLARLDYRMVWEDVFRAYLQELDAKKPVVVCGDLNVAAEEIDLKNPKTNRKNAGFTDEERSCFDKVLASGYIDTYRYFYPDTEGVYSWWSYRFKAREKNAGWRIDYFVVSEDLKDRLAGAAIHTQVMGSDHCPIELDLNAVDMAAV